MRSVIVVCGAAGDLTKRKLLPALYNLAQSALLSRDTAIVDKAGSRDRRRFRRVARQGHEARSPAGARSGALGLAPTPHLLNPGARRAAASPRPHDSLTRVDTEHGTRGNVLLLPRHPARVFRGSSASSARPGYLRGPAAGAA